MYSRPRPFAWAKRWFVACLHEFAEESPEPPFHVDGRPSGWNNETTLMGPSAAQAVNIGAARTTLSGWMATTLMTCRRLSLSTTAGMLFAFGKRSWHCDGCFPLAARGASRLDGASKRRPSLYSLNLLMPNGDAHGCRWTSVGIRTAYLVVSIGPFDPASDVGGRTWIAWWRPKLDSNQRPPD
jgi:hypothetical protein